MKIAVLKETRPGERRVALVPASVTQYQKSKCEVLVERSAGQEAGYPDKDYEAAGAQIVDRSTAIHADVILQVRTMGTNLAADQTDLDCLCDRQTLIGMCDPLGAPQSVQRLASTGASLFALELIPRITRAQSMDVLSSMATVAGYRAVLLAAIELPRMFPLMMTAAGTLTPARAFVIGAGVAGLQAIATAKRLGAVVHAYDVRPAVKDQIESLGARFVELPLEAQQTEDKGGYAKELGEDFYRRQRELMAKVVAESDIVITTAAIPGKPSPRLITAEAVQGMQPGSVIVDLAAERGGNCELSKADQRIVQHGVTILGPTNLPSEVPYHASQMLSKNILTFVRHLLKDGELAIDHADPISHETLVAEHGEVVNERIRELLGMATIQPAEASATGGQVD